MPEAKAVYVVETPQGATESFDSQTIVTLVRLGLIEHERSGYLLEDGQGNGIGRFHHFYRGGTAETPVSEGEPEEPYLKVRDDVLDKLEDRAVTATGDYWAKSVRIPAHMLRSLIAEVRASRGRDSDSNPA